MARLDMLGGILKRIGNFNPGLAGPSAFNSRLVLQKTIYLLQAFGINLKYSFSWYVRGPYSPSLAKDGYMLAHLFEKIPPIKFTSASDETKFISFLEFLDRDASNPEWLETISSIHLLKQTNSSLTKGELFKELAQKKPHLKKEAFDGAYERLRKFGLFSMRGV